MNNSNYCDRIEAELALLIERDSNDLEIERTSRCKRLRALLGESRPWRA